MKKFISIPGYSPVGNSTVASVGDMSAMNEISCPEFDDIAAKKAGMF